MVLRKSPVIGQLTHAWASTSQSVSSHFQLPVSFTSTVYIGINYANVWHGDVVWCHKVTEFKAGLLTQQFRHFCGSVLWGKEELIQNFDGMGIQSKWIFGVQLDRAVPPVATFACEPRQECTGKCLDCIEREEEREIKQEQWWVRKERSWWWRWGRGIQGS